MTDSSTPRYRYWGHQKPIAFAPLAEATTTTGKTAQMRIYGPIDSWGAPFGVSADEFSQALDQIGEGVDTIELHMHSVGGEVFEGLAIMNQLRQHKATVNVVVDGIAASIASVICMGADSVAMAPGAQMMIHDASGICMGTAQDMATMNAALESLSSNIADIYASKAGGTADEWRTAMQPESWYKAQEAVDAGLAERVLTADEAGTAPKAQFDLSVFAHAGREHAPAPRMPVARCRCGSNSTDVSGDPSMEHKDECPTKTPADQPVTPPTDHKEAVTMTDIPTAGLVKALGLPDDADEDAILDALDTQIKAARKVDDKPAASTDVKSVVAALEADGKVVVSRNVLDELTSQAKAGAQARAKQLEEERDATIAQAFTAGKISAERRDAWKASWDKDPEGTKADLDSLPARFPVAQLAGHQGDGDTTADVVMTEAQAEALAAQFGVSKEALING